MIKAIVERKESAKNVIWELGMRLQKANVWRFTKKKRERLKGVQIMKNYFEDLYTAEQVAVNMCGFNGVKRGNYFGGEPR